MFKWGQISADYETLSDCPNRESNTRPLAWRTSSLTTELLRHGQDIIQREISNPPERRQGHFNTQQWFALVWTFSIFSTLLKEKCPFNYETIEINKIVPMVCSSRQFFYILLGLTWPLVLSRNPLPFLTNMVYTIQATIQNVLTVWRILGRK